MENKYIYKKDNYIQFFSFNSKEDYNNFLNKNQNSKIYECDADSILDAFFYDAFEWDDDNNKPFINIEKAKLIQLKYLKTFRDPYFKFLDIEFIKSLETNNLEKKDQITNLKQKLRDLNSNEFPNSIEELNKFKPKVFVEIESLI